MHLTLQQQTERILCFCKTHKTILQKCTLHKKSFLTFTLKKNKTTKNTADLFREVCNLLQLSDDEYVDSIADFFESLTTSKEFILLEDGTWDLKSNHKVKVVIEELDEEADEDESEEDELDNMEDTLEDDLDLIDDDSFIDDDVEDDLADLTIVDDDELED